MSEMIKLYPVKEFQFPVMAECINPDVFKGKSHAEIGELELWEGNRQRKLGELFKIEETNQEHGKTGTTVTIHGDASKVRRVGAHLTAGKILIKGDVGTHLGEEMKGGEIIVHGDVGGWAGSMMKGGTIEIHGKAGNYLAAPYRGSSEGMNGGEIIVYGNVGSEAGAYLKKGSIKIYGSTGQFPGLRMRKGTIYIQKNCKGRAGACMKNGKIVIGGFLESVLPTFTIDGVRKKAKIGDETVEGPFYRFLGYLTENGRGKLFVHKEKNPQLSHYEKFL